MSKQHDKTYLLDILTAAKYIKEFVKNKTLKEFESDVMLNSAVIRQFEIIGEATKRISMNFREKHTDIPWRNMAGMRDVLIHNYEEANIEKIWQVAIKNIPEIINKIKKILAELK